ncbi:hypothetical protein NC652_008402 [Populus alba x Populus x berolinensis]|nr:hypothetical protein NC652_008402 [Populus alba x Populus x berolinensis]
MGFGRKTNNPNTQNFVWAFAITDHIEVELTWVSAASHICLELVGLFEENRSTAWYVIYATFFNDI